MHNLVAAWQITMATLQRRHWSLVTFAGIAAAFQFIVAASFPAIGGMEAVESVIETFPPGLRQLLKLAPNLQAGFGLVDYLAFTWIHPFFLAVGTGFAVSRAADAVAAEVESGSIYLTLSRPVARYTLVLGKVSEMIIGTGVIVLASLFGMALGIYAAQLDPVILHRYLPVALMAWPLFVALGGVGLVTSSVSSRAGFAAGIGAVWTLVAFVVDVIPATAQSPLAWLNPWHYYFPQEIVANQEIDTVGLVVLLLWIVIPTAVAALLFTRRDLA